MNRVILALGLAMSGAALAQHSKATASTDTSMQYVPTDFVPIPAMDVERLQLNPSSNGSMVMGDGELTPAGALRANALAHLVSGIPITRRLDGLRTVETDRFLVSGAAAYGLTRWLEANLQLGAVLRQSSSLPDFSVPNTALLSPVFALRMALPPGVLPFAVSGEIGMSIPIGSPAALVGGVRPSPRARLNFGRRFDAFDVFGELNLVERPDVSLGGLRGVPGDSLNDELGGGLGVSAPIPGTAWSAEAAAMVSYDYKHPGAAAVLHLAARYQFKFRRSGQLFFAAEPGFGALVGTPAFRLLAGVCWSFDAPKDELAE